MRRTAVVLGVSVASISRWSRIDSGIRVRSPRASMITDAIRATVDLFLKQQTRLSSLEVVDHIRKLFGITVSRQLAHTVVRSLGYTFKRTRKRGRSKRKHDATPPFLESFASAFIHGNVVAIDESGFDQRPSPAYGYAKAGTPAIVHWTPSSDRTRLNLLMAIHANGSCNQYIQDKPINGEAFATFIRSLPFDRGTTLLMDNASIHKTAAVRYAMDEKGFNPLFVPPYSPEYNPIELVFGIIKNAFYRLRYSESFLELRTAVQTCVDAKAIDATIRNCFRHVAGLVSMASI